LSYTSYYNYAKTHKINEIDDIAENKFAPLFMIMATRINKLPLIISSLRHSKPCHAYID